MLLLRASVASVLAFSVVGVAHAQSDAELGLGEGAAVAVVEARSVGPDSTFVTLSTGGLVWVRGRRFVVTQEPAPASISEDAPPAPPRDALTESTAPFENATWVQGHWRHDGDGFSWVEGRHIARKPGHVFVPPRWVCIGNRYLFFDGFFVPHRVWVRSFFNTFHFSGDPSQQAERTARDRGPYWPIGVSGRPVGVQARSGRGPYWPLGLGPPTVLNRQGTVVGLPSRSGRR